MAVCRTVAEARAAGHADGRQDPPLTQDQADYVAAILASARTPAAQAA